MRSNSCSTASSLILESASWVSTTTGGAGARLDQPVLVVLAGDCRAAPR